MVLSNAFVIIIITTTTTTTKDNNNNREFRIRLKPEEEFNVLNYLSTNLSKGE